MDKELIDKLNALGVKYNLNSNDVMVACEALRMGAMMCPHRKAEEMVAAFGMILGTFINTLGHGDIADEFLEVARNVNHEGN